MVLWNELLKSMTKIIQLRNFEDYYEQIAITIAQLDDFIEELHHQAVCLAVKNKWKMWDHDIPEGSEFEFSREMLSNTGDSNVDAIVSLIDEAFKVKNNFESRKY